MSIATHLLKVPIAIENGEAIERLPSDHGSNGRTGLNREMEGRELAIER